MPELEDIRSLFTWRLEETRQRRPLEVRADTIEDALMQGSIETGLNIEELDYEIQKKGFQGIFGLGKRPYIISVYPAAGVDLTKLVITGEDDDFGATVDENDLVELDALEVVDLSDDDLK